MKKPLLFLTLMLGGISYADAQEKKTPRLEMSKCARGEIARMFFPCVEDGLVKGQKVKSKEKKEVGLSVGAAPPRVASKEKRDAIDVPQVGTGYLKFGSRGDVSGEIFPKGIPKKKVAKVPLKPSQSDVVISYMSKGDDPLYLTDGEIEQTVIALQACAREITQGKKAECLDIPIGSLRVIFEFTPSCIENQFCAKALVTKKWCREQKGEWSIIENNFLCDSLAE